MPDDKGELTQADRDRIVEYFTEKGVKPTCPLCGNDYWLFASHLVIAPLITPKGMAVGSGFPAALVVCSKCHFFRLHGAIAMGLIPAGAKMEEE
jgi:hypothetical protein